MSYSSNLAQSRCPPYIERELHQPTVSGIRQLMPRNYGAVAAPTAGLHFTTELLQRCQEQGIAQSYVTLHVGVGTFRPIAAENLEEHRMHSEWCELQESTVKQLQETKEQGGRVVAVGTTSVRTLESASQSGELRPFLAQTDLFIRPPYEFQVVDALLTNFHLPKSSLLVLVSAFADREFIMQGYAEAIAQRYRFFSYGDAMLIL